MNFKNEREKKAFYFFIILVLVFILMQCEVILSESNEEINLLNSVNPASGSKSINPPVEDSFKNFNTLSSAQQSDAWRNFVNINDKAQQDSIWVGLSYEKQKEILNKISQGKFSYFNDFKGLGENMKKSILKNHMDSIVPLLSKNDVSVFDKEDAFSKYPDEIAAGFDGLFKKSDESAKSEAAKLFFGEKTKEDKVETQKSFLTNKQKEDLFNKLDVKSQEGLLMKMSEKAFDGASKLKNGKNPKLESVSLEKGAKYKWVGNKLGIDDGKGNLKAWIDFDSLPPQMTKLKYEKGVFEASLYSGRVISFNAGSINKDGKPVRPNGKILGGSKRELSLTNGIVSGSDKSQIDIRYDDQGFAKISLSGNEEQTAIVGKDSMGNEFWFTQFHQDDKNEKGEVIKDTSSAEIEIAPNDEIRAKNSIIYGSFGRKVTSKTGFTEIGSSGLLGGDKWSQDRIKEVMGDVGKNMGSSIANLANTIAGLSGKAGNKIPSDVSQADSFVPQLEEETSSASSASSGYALTSDVGFKGKTDTEGFFNVEYGSKGLKITDEGKAYGVVDVTHSSLPIEEVRIKSEGIVANEADVRGRAVNQRYLIDGNSVLRFGKDETYIERSFENAAVPIRGIVNENLKNRDGNNFKLVLDNYGGRYQLYLDQSSPRLTDDQKLTDLTTVTTTLKMTADPKTAKERFGTRKGAGTVYGDLLEVEISNPASFNGEVTNPDVQISTLDPSSAALGLLNPGLQRRNGPLATGAREQALTTAVSQITSGLQENDPAQQILGEAQTKIDSQVSQVREIAKSMGYNDLKSFSNAITTASDKGLQMTVAGIPVYTTNPLNLNADQKEALAFIANYDNEMQKFAEFKKQATLQGLGTGSLSIKSSTGTLESNGVVLSSPFIAKQIARNIASDEGINRFNMIRDKAKNEFQKDPSAVSRVRSYGATSYGTSSSGTQISNGQSTQTTQPPVIDVLNVQIPGVNTGCSGGSCGTCSGGSCN